MRLRCTRVIDGIGPSERIAQFATRDGIEEVAVYSGLLEGNDLLVSAVLGRDGGRALVELPRESASGRWRVWVPQEALAG